MSRARQAWIILIPSSCPKSRTSVSPPEKMLFCPKQVERFQADARLQHHRVASMEEALQTATCGVQAMQEQVRLDQNKFPACTDVPQLQCTFLSYQVYIQTSVVYLCGCRFCGAFSMFCAPPLRGVGVRCTQQEYPHTCRATSHPDRVVPKRPVGNL